MRSWAYNRFGVLMGASWLASGLRWPSLRVDVVPMITLFPSQGYFCATAQDPIGDILAWIDLVDRGGVEVLLHFFSCFLGRARLRNTSGVGNNRKEFEEDLWTH